MYLFVCVWMDVVYEDEVGPRGRWVASSERMIMIALAGRQTGKHIFDCLFDPRVCRGKQQTCWKKMMSTTRSNVDLSVKTRTTTIIHSFTVCWWCSSENLHHHNNYISTLIIFKREPSAMQMPLSSSLRFVAKHSLISFSFSPWTENEQTKERSNEPTNERATVM